MVCRTTVGRAHHAVRDHTWQDSRPGKSVTKDRAMDSWLRPPEAMVGSTAYPSSEIGLVQILGGKRE